MLHTTLKGISYSMDSLEQMKKHNEAIGQFYFSDNTMRSFKTLLYDIWPLEKLDASILLYSDTTSLGSREYYIDLYDWRTGYLHRCDCYLTIKTARKYFAQATKMNNFDISRRFPLQIAKLQSQISRKAEQNG